MAFIKINRIKTYSFIGCMDEEKKIGSEYETDIEINFMCCFEKLKMDRTGSHAVIINGHSGR